MLLRKLILVIAPSAFVLAALASLPTSCGSNDNDNPDASTSASSSSGATTSSTSATNSTSGAAGGAGGAGGTAKGGSGGAATGGNGGAGLGKPIDAPAGQWSWIDFDDAFCANGSTTGIGINPGPKSERLLIYMRGGGACWDHESCYVKKLAVAIESGFGASDFNYADPFINSGMFDRSDATNPFKDASYVFVPYCTGDLHAGNTVTNHGGKPTSHVGFANMGAFLNRLVPTFPAIKQVVLSGGSAGGFGATMNWDRTQIAFGQRVDMIDDSGPWLPNPYLPEALEQKFRTAWGIDANLPSGCASCLDKLDTIYTHVANKYPASRGALLSYMVDPVVAAYFGISLAEFTEGLVTLAPAINALANSHYFGKAGSNHVLLKAGWAKVSQSGVTLKQWITQMVDDDPNWKSISP